MQALTLLASAALFLLSTTTEAATPTELKLWRLDCGVIQEDDLNLYSDTYAYVGKSKQLTAGCYLIKHGDSYMLWDTGLSTEAIGKPLQGPGATGESLSKSLSEQLIKLGVDPSRSRSSASATTTSITPDKRHRFRKRGCSWAKLMSPRCERRAARERNR